MKLPESRRASLALVGCGYWGRNLARNFHHFGCLHTICETRPEQVSALQATYPDVRFTGDLDAVLSDPHIGQVAIAAPAIHHYSMAKLCLLAGKDVFVEKPFCLNVSEGVELKEMAERHGRILMIGHLLQYHPAVCRLQDMVAEGAFGKRFRITSRRLNLGKVRKEENAFWSLAPHDISVVLSLIADSPPISVQSIAESYLQPGIADCSFTSITFANGTSAEIQVSWLHPFKEQKLCLIGETAMAVFDDTQPWESKLTVRRKYFESQVIETIPIVSEEPLRKECQHFIDCCMDRSLPKTNAEEAIRVVRILEAAQASADQNGKRILIKDQNPPPSL